MLSSDSPITLAYFGPPNLPFVSTIFNEWIRKYPDLRFDIITDSLDRMIKMLQSGEIDALITLNPSVAGLDGIGTKRLERINPAVILPRDHVLSKNKFISVDELRSSGPVLLPKGPNRFADKVLADLCSKWSIDANTEIESEALAYHVSCGEGLGLKPVFFRNDNQNLFDTVQIPLDDGTGLFNRVFAYSYENENPMFKKCLEVVDSCISGRLFD